MPKKPMNTRKPNAANGPEPGKNGGEAVAAVSRSPISDKEDEIEVVPSNFLDYVSDLRGLSAALSMFICRFDELGKHLAFIQNSIDSHSLSTKPSVVSNDVRSSKSRDTSRSTIECLCDTMGGRGLRKYIASHLADTAKLREEVPPVLKRVPNPPKLVLDCTGRFYLQGTKAFSRASHMIAARQASFLILEFFLLSGASCTHIEQSVKQEAQVAALAWRQRLISEGGFSSATIADARGLLLFVASFGIPFDFRNDDLVHLIRLSDSVEIADALRRSPFLRDRIPDVIQEMIKSGMFVAAVDTIFTFGLDDKFPPQTILMSYLHESKDACERARGESEDAPVKLKEAKEKQLDVLKSVIRCLEKHKIDPTVLPGWNINLKVPNLEDDISELDKIIEERVISKRKIEELEPFKELRPFNGKRPCPTDRVSQQRSSTFMQSQDQSMGSIANEKSLYNAEFSDLWDGYSGAPPITGFGLAGTNGTGVLPGAINRNMVGGSSGLLTWVSPRRGTMAMLPTVTVAGTGGGLHEGNGPMQQIDNSVRSTVWKGNGALSENFLGHGFMELPPSTVGVSFVPTLYSDQRFLGQPSTSLDLGNRNSGTDLYQFADTVLDTELNYKGSSQRVITRGAGAAAAGAHWSSYLH